MSAVPTEQRPPLGATPPLASGTAERRVRGASARRGTAADAALRRAVVVDAADRGDRVLDHVPGQRRPQPRIDDHYRDRADARLGTGGGGGRRAHARRAIARGGAEVRAVAGRAAARVRRPERAVGRVVGTARRQLAGRGQAARLRRRVRRGGRARAPRARSLAGDPRRAGAGCGGRVLGTRWRRRSFRAASRRRTHTRAWRNRTATGTRSA